ncbi:hypothetical protein ACH4E7_22195 [Kitasatospora sp. NPDC018058]|uniref:hypothetical protein n=1 Tax=Kitasatospora sp. NPDC018058 TaxID=3364025 RepID=UPI0037C137C4
MSLNSRVIAALGAVVVVGAGTVGGSIAYASGQTEISDHRVTLTVGNSSQAQDPFCANDDGSPLSDDDQQKCSKKAQDALKAGTLPSSDVVLSDRVGVGVSPTVAKKGWVAFSNGGPLSGGGQFSVSSWSKNGSTYSGSHAAGQLLNASGRTLITVVEGDRDLESPTAIWYFQLNTQES